MNRLQVEHWYDLHPEIDEQAVEVELLGVGFPRTGSTALSCMLAEDNRFRSLRIWEETSPCPPPGLFPDQDEARVEAARAMVERSHGAMAARLRSMLPRSSTGPMEDHDIMAMEFKAQYFLVSAHIPSYAEWFANCDMEPTYRYEKRVLKLLQWKTPEKRWRLKSPTHTMFLTDYEKVFPGARFVQTHRDISKVLPSVSDLYSTMLRAGNPDTDPRYVGALNLEQWSIALDRMLEFRQDPDARRQVLRHRLQRVPGRPDDRDRAPLRLAGRRAGRLGGGAHAGLAGGQPEGRNTAGTSTTLGSSVSPTRRCPVASPRTPSVSGAFLD